MKMRVTRAFLLGGMRQEKGTEVEIDSRADAAMLQHEGKAVPVEPSTVSGPMTTETAAGMVPGKSAAKSSRKDTSNE